PSRVTLDLDMATPGLLVLADLWYEGWHATLDGQPVPVLRVNHALRGVVVPAGKGKLVFDYLPGGYVVGIRLSLAGLAVLPLWAVVLGFRNRHSQARRAEAVPGGMKTVGLPSSLKRSKRPSRSSRR